MKNKYMQFIGDHERYSINLVTKDFIDQDIKGTSHIGGKPDLPVDFNWPVYTDTEISGDTYPLAFIAQFNCEELKKCDTDGLLPETGILLFFYDTEGQPWGFDEEKDGARVYWFEDVNLLETRDLPKEISEENRIPYLSIEFEQNKSYPGWEDYSLINSEMTVEEINEYSDILEDDFNYESKYETSKLLGWADVVQSSMLPECEKMTSCENSKLSKENLLDEWQLLLQFTSIYEDDFELLFGDCGNIYFYIRTQDLMNRNFENVWCMLQC